jgi:hypothetical protein
MLFQSDYSEILALEDPRFLNQTVIKDSAQRLKTFLKATHRYRTALSQLSQAATLFSEAYKDLAEAEANKIAANAAERTGKNSDQWLKQ